MAAMDTLIGKIQKTLKKEFPDETVDVWSSPIPGNLRIVVVSRRFDQMDDAERDSYLWKVLENAKLTRSEQEKISAILPYSPSQLR